MKKWQVMTTVSSRSSLYYSKLTVITLCSDISVLMQKFGYAVLSAITKFVKIRRALIIANNKETRRKETKE